MPLTGTTGRFPITHPNTYFEQPRTLWRTIFTETDREHLVKNISGPLSGASRDKQEGMLALFYKIDPDYGTRISKAIGVPINKARL